MLLTTFEFDKKRKWAGKETAKLKIKNLNHCISFWENLKCEIQKWENINIVTFLLDFIPLMHGIPYTQSGVIQPSWLWRLLYFVNCDYEVSLNRGSRLCGENELLVEFLNHDIDTTETNTSQYSDNVILLVHFSIFSL